MKNRKWYVIAMFVAGCVAVNYAGKLFALNLRLPLWLDAFGTMLAAYVSGPVCGAMVGVTVNLIYAAMHSWDYVIYACVSAMVGITVGLCAKKGYLKSLFGVLSVSFLVTVLSVLISVPLNFRFFGGYTQNIWGDGVINAMKKIGFNNLISCCMGEFYLDFLDKVVTVLTLYILIKLYHKKRSGTKGKVNIKKITAHMLVLVFAGSLCIQGVHADEHTEVAGGSEEKSAENYNKYLQTIYGRKNGIPGGLANDIAQTNDGVLWFGTYGGLYRYNGTEFEWIDEYESVKTVNCLYRDEEGRLWIGTNDSGVSIVIKDTLTNVISHKDGLAADSVRCITQSADGDYYVGTTGELSVLTLAGGLSVKQTIHDVTYARSMSADSVGNVAVVADEGSLYLINSGRVEERLTCSGDADYTSCLFIDDKLYVGNSDNMIEVYSMQGNKPVYQKALQCDGIQNIKSIYFHDDGTIFVCADNGAAYFDCNGNYQLINTGAFNSSIDHMLVDYQGNLWFTSSRLGVMRMCKSVFSWIDYGLEDEEQVVNSTAVLKGRLYIGTDNGLVIYDESIGGVCNNELTEVLAGVRIRCIYVDTHENMWICTSGKGVYEVLPDDEIIVYDSGNGAGGNKFRTMVELSDGEMLAAGDFGLTFIKSGKVVNTVGYEDGMNNPKVLCALENSDGTILAGTDGNGIDVIDNGKVVDNLGKDDGLSSEVVLRMVKDEENDGIFIVTSNNICYMDNDGIRILDNFPYYNNYDMVEGSDNTMFVLSSAGIYVVDKDELLAGNTLEYKLLNSGAGLDAALTPNAWNHVDEAGKLYFSTDVGVMCMDLNNYEVSIRSYRMQMKSIELDDEKYIVESGEDIRIASGVQKVEIFPEIINYSVNVPYVSVYLEGYDDKPRVMLQSELTGIIYTGLPIGTYTFHLAVLDSKGQNPVVENTYTIIKEAEIYDNWWFMIYMVAVFAIAVAYLTWLIFRTQVQRVMSLQKKELELAKTQLELGNETVLTIARTVDAKDVNTSQHSARVAEYSVLIGKELGFDDARCEQLKKAALLHDIGKIGIPDRILNKPDRLTDEEYAIMKSHVVKGGEILKSFTLIEHVEDGALYHHERYDGKGYVHGLKGEEIPLNARIIGIADAFDAMTANRVYRKQLDMKYVIEEIKKGKGTQFDPKLADILLELIDIGRIDVESLYHSMNNKVEGSDR